MSGFSIQNYCYSCKVSNLVIENPIQIAQSPLDCSGTLTPHTASVTYPAIPYNTQVTEVLIISSYLDLFTKSNSPLKQDCTLKTCQLQQSPQVALFDQSQFSVKMKANLPLGYVQAVVYECIIKHPDNTVFNPSFQVTLNLEQKALDCT